MSFSEFHEKLLIGLYQNDNFSGDWHDLAEVQRKYGLAGDLKLLSLAAKHLKSEGRVNVRELVGAAIKGKLTGAGYTYIEGKYSTKGGVGTIPEPVVGQESLEFAASNRAIDYARPVPSTHDSSTWTGLPRQGFLTAAAAERLKTSLVVVEDAVALSTATNEEKAQARAYVLAIHALANAPEPPADLIWELVSRANQISGIAALFVSIMALFG